MDEFVVELEDGGERKQEKTQKLRSTKVGEGYMSEDTATDYESGPEEVKSEGEGTEKELPLPALEGRHDWTATIEKYLSACRSKKRLHAQSIVKLCGDPESFQTRVLNSRYSGAS